MRAPKCVGQEWRMSRAVQARHTEEFGASERLVDDLLAIVGMSTMHCRAAKAARNPRLRP
jgi:hypothetical protein